MSVFGWDRESGRLALVREITQKVLDGKDDRMKPVAVWVLALASIRDGELKAAIECLDRFNSMKGNTEDERLCQLVRCLANAMRDSEMAAPEAIALRDAIAANTDAVLDYRALALLTEIEVRTGIAVRKSERPKNPLGWPETK